MDPRSTIVVRYRESSRGAPGAVIVAWAVLMAVSIFGISAHLASDFFEVLAISSTFLAAAYLGWKRAMAVIFFAPIVAWLFGWAPLIVGQMIHRGVFSGFLWGIFWVTIGWIVIGAAQFVALFVMALPFRIVSGLIHHDTVIIDRPWG